jgi:hypothetical protein
MTNSWKKPTRNFCSNLQRLTVTYEMLKELCVENLCQVSTFLDGVSGFQKVQTKLSFTADQKVERVRNLV